jgi:hypothetical protein
VSVQYCQKAPRNPELNGLFQCQFQSTDPVKFTGGAKVPDPGTFPFGQTAILNPPGSCPAHPSGPIPDGTQLVDQVSSPGLPPGNNPGNGTNGGTPSSDSPQTSSTLTPVVSSTAPAAPSSQTSTSSASSGTSGFHVQNGKDAQALNLQFQSLTPDSSCSNLASFDAHYPH